MLGMAPTIKLLHHVDLVLVSMVPSTQNGRPSIYIVIYEIIINLTLNITFKVTNNISKIEITFAFYHFWSKLYFGYML